MSIRPSRFALTLGAAAAAMALSATGAMACPDKSASNASTASDMTVKQVADTGMAGSTSSTDSSSAGVKSDKSDRAKSSKVDNSKSATSGGSDTSSSASTSTSGTSASPGASGAGSMSTSGTSSSKGTASSATLAAADKSFVTKAAQGGLFEVQFGKLIADKASDADVKSFGQMLVDDHTKANEQLQQIASTHNVTLPTSLPSNKQKMLDQLGKLSGADFDKRVRAEAIKDHQHDISDFKKESKGAKADDVKTFAQSSLPTLEKHLQAAQKLHASSSGKGKG